MLNLYGNSKSLIYKLNILGSTLSNVGRDTNSPDRFFMAFLSLSKQVSGNILNYATTASIHILF
jgi:hypothetical protein